MYILFSCLEDLVCCSSCPSVFSEFGGSRYSKFHLFHVSAIGLVPGQRYTIKVRVSL